MAVPITSIMIFAGFMITPALVLQLATIREWDHFSSFFSEVGAYCLVLTRKLIRQFYLVSDLSIAVNLANNTVKGTCRPLVDLEFGFLSRIGGLF